MTIEELEWHCKKTILQSTKGSKRYEEHIFILELIEELKYRTELIEELKYRINDEGDNKIVSTLIKDFIDEGKFCTQNFPSTDLGNLQVPNVEMKILRTKENY